MPAKAAPRALPRRCIPDADRLRAMLSRARNALPAPSRSAKVGGITLRRDAQLHAVHLAGAILAGACGEATGPLRPMCAASGGRAAGSGFWRGGYGGPIGQDRRIGRRTGPAPGVVPEARRSLICGRRGWIAVAAEGQLPGSAGPQGDHRSGEGGVGHESHLLRALAGAGNVCGTDPELRDCRPGA